MENHQNPLTTVTVARLTLLWAVIASSIAVCLLCALVLMTYSLHAMNFAHLYDSE